MPRRHSAALCSRKSVGSSRNRWGWWSNREQPRRIALFSLELLHGLQRLVHVLRGTHVADGGRDLSILRHDERRALGEAMADFVAARVLGARLGVAHLQVVALRDLAVRVGGHGNLASAVLGVG